ncbi:SMI1/KNR4 family protein [Shewanella sairae]|uniref:SMI1/KNR4 family protein n=1 Tax=Shewanella sairae TaxID=190310 RepID=UPI00200DFA12|nr:SMI1/KNR4 family protein [Shewanella sairae]MCL1132544.1 SMI1/KNR4 family protein [Shewanella sairae]
MTSLREVVESNRSYFEGDTFETKQSLLKAEVTLGVNLPEELKWLLINVGYGECSVLSSLEDSVSDTIRFRNSAKLPSKFIVLEDLNDSGVVVLNTASDNGEVTWLTAHETSKLADIHPLNLTDADYYPSLSEWLIFKLDVKVEESEHCN